MSNYTYQQRVTAKPEGGVSESSTCQKILWDEKVQKDLANFRRQRQKRAR